MYRQCISITGVVITAGLLTTITYIYNDTATCNVPLSPKFHSDETGLSKPKSDLLMEMLAQSYIEQLYPPCQSLTEAEFWEAMEKRKTHVQRMCQIYKERNYEFYWKIDWDVLSNRPQGTHPWYNEIVVSDKYKLLYQKIQKAGTTNFLAYINNFESVFGNYTYDKIIGPNITLSNKTSPHHLASKVVSYANMYSLGLIESVEDAKAKFETYYKAIFFREPLDRIISMFSFFTGRTFTKQPFHMSIGILKNVRNLNKSVAEISRAIASGKMQHLTVTEYLQFILGTDDSASLNKHYRPQMINAMICDISYDFIGKSEDMSCEIKFLVKKLTGSYPKISLPTRAKPENEKLPKVLSGVLPQLIRDVLLKHYKIDYDFLGYPFPV